jgi:2-iminobutanoate/2-iminopropanoate deaminase
MKKVISTQSAPLAIGAYSQAIEYGKTGNLVFLSGQLGLDPASGILVEGGVGAQTRQALRNIEFILSSAGYSLGDILKTTIFLTDIADFQEVNEVYASSFSGDYPARSAVAVKSLPKGGLVEIEVIAGK